MKKTYAKFQNDRYKTVRGVALTRGTHRLHTEGEQELRQAGHYTPVASNKLQYINWLLYNSVLRI